jgi:hypothetical protein
LNFEGSLISARFMSCFRLTHATYKVKLRAKETAGEAMRLARVQAHRHRRPRRGLSRYFLPVKNSLMFSPLNLAPSTMVWPTPVNISLNPGPT